MTISNVYTGITACFGPSCSYVHVTKYLKSADTVVECGHSLHTTEGRASTHVEIS